MTPKDELASDAPIEYLRLSVRAFRRLKGAGIRTLGDVNARTDAELCSIADLGRKTLLEIRSVTRNGAAEQPWGLTSDLQAKVNALETENKWLRSLLFTVGIRNWRQIDKTLARDADIVADRLSGLSYSAIADGHAITHQRVQQICDRFVKRMRHAVKNFREIDPALGPKEERHL